MHVDRPSTLPAVKAPEETFTGDVSVRGFFVRSAPSRLVGATVSFAPGSRTPRKVNPLGQTVIVVDGVGYAQCKGEPIVEIRVGDIVWIPPGTWHWDGATPDHAMTYVAIQEAESGPGVVFGESVSDADYHGRPRAEP